MLSIHLGARGVLIINLILLAFNISGMNNSSNYPISIARFSDAKPPSQHLKTHFPDLPSQRIGNVPFMRHYATAFLINQSSVAANPMLTQLLVSLRAEYTSAAFAKSSGGFSLVENYFDNNFKPTPLLSAATHAQINQLQQIIYHAAHYDGFSKSFENALHLVKAHVPIENRLMPVAHAWNKAVQEMSGIIFDSKGCLKNSLTQQESQKLIHIHCEYLKSTTNCLAEWYDQMAALSYGDARYLHYLKEVVRNQDSILTKITTQGPLRGVDKLTADVVGICKTCVNWFVGNRTDHEKLHAFERNSTNTILKSVIGHCNKGEFQAALDYGNQAGIFGQYHILHREIIGKLPKGVAAQTVSTVAAWQPHGAMAQPTSVALNSIEQSKPSQSLNMNGLAKSPSETTQSPQWPYSLQAPVVAALSKFEQKPTQTRTLSVEKKIQLGKSVTEQMSKDLTVIKNRAQDRLFVDNNQQQLVIHQRRTHALAFTEQTNVMFEKNYKAHALSIMIAKEINADQHALEYCFGNHMQQQIHGEFVEVINKSAQQYYTKDAPISQKEVNKMICEWAFTGLSRNQQGKVAQSTSLANLCWSALECAQATLNASNSAVNTVADCLINVIDKVDSLLQEIAIPKMVRDYYKNSGFGDIPKSIRPESRMLKCIVRFFEGRIRGPIDLVAHPTKNITAALKSLKTLGKLAVTYVDYCDTLDSAHLLEPVACAQRINQLEDNLSAQVETITHEFLDSFNAVVNLPAEDIAYLIGYTQGQQKFVKRIASVGSRIKSKLWSSTAVSNPNFEYWQSLAAAMKDAKPIYSFKVQNTTYVFYDNGAVFAGTQIGTMKKMWCVINPKRVAAGAGLQLAGGSSVYITNVMPRAVGTETVQVVASGSNELVAYSARPALTVGSKVAQISAELSKIATVATIQEVASAPALITTPPVDLPKPTLEVGKPVIIDPVTPQLKAEWMAQKKEVVKTLKKWIDQYQSKVGKTDDFIEHRDWLRTEIQEFNKPECAHHIATLSDGVHTIIPKELQPFLPSAKELAHFEKQLDIIPQIKKISGKDVDVLIGNLEHIFCPEVKVDCVRGKVGIQGAHYYPALEQLEKEGLVKVPNKVLNPDGTHTVNWSYHGSKNKKSTCFPREWSSEKIVQKINEATKCVIKAEWNKDGRLLLIGQTSEGIKIKMIFEFQNNLSKNLLKITSCYPFLEE